jgi:hypothetical protein
VSANIIAGLLDDMEESYAANGHLPLYELGWSLRNGRPMTTAMIALAQQAYDEFTSRHRTRVVLTPWPIDLDSSEPLPPDTPLDFDLDPDAPVGALLQVLVPADYAVST